MRPIDLARAAGVSQQAVRNYEAQGIIDSAARTAHGYRVYEQRHLDQLRAFVALSRAVGHATGASILTAVVSGRTADALDALDRAHGRIVADRETIHQLDGVLRAAAHLPPDPEPARVPLTVGEVARHIGVTAATLRSWERAGALRPRRHHTGHREYTPRDVADARLVHLLRRGHFPLPQIALAISRIHGDGDATTALQQTADWRQRLNEQSLALLHASAELAKCIGPRHFGSVPQHLDRSQG
ncbi:MerR family transcriptional regulator [Nocardia stercoris]|uniref:MerR family transcriptional regulator n=2 Tax=Nocardia stercoris TaxID=2483361 RepID=A0A3M2LF04_9NOCA|nr:MerR family transcriptional regulator [Nocardia stercoris]